MTATDRFLAVVTSWKVSALSASTPVGPDKGKVQDLNSEWHFFPVPGPGVLPTFLP